MPVDVFPASGSRVSEGVSPDHMSRDAPETGVDVAHIHGDRVDVSGTLIQRHQSSHSEWAINWKGGTFFEKGGN